MTRAIVGILQRRHHMWRAWRLLQDRRIPLWQKAIPFLALAYIVSPLNIISFAVPILGQFDDLFVLFGAIELFERVVDDRILADYPLPT